ncbi:MAG: pyridoxal phosphate-dependent aminotransferase [Caldilineaceae bacterium]|nr:pyridoxal phosphate-dependent aminotransferase [Caldilineaceae bacterium]HRJ41076.1 MalY/PatB family protein [Caldilineaceae bacterium]
MIYNFDEIISRKGTHSVKWEAGELLKQFGITERFDEETISLFVADMDFQCPQPVLDALHARVDTRMFGYSIHSASSDYHEAIQGWFKRRHGWEIAAESIVYSPGTVEALNVAVRIYTKEGDGVIIQRPVYSPFTSSITGNQRVVVNNSLINTDGYYTIDFDDLEAKAKDPNNTLFILCSPHNPVGRVWTQEELIRMAEICLANDVVLIADEIHGDLVRKGVTHHPIRTLVDDDRLISCTATNKTFNMAGLHCANIIIPDAAMRERFTEKMGFKLPTPFAITALIAAYNEGEEWLAQVNEYIDGNLTFMQNFLTEHMPKVKYRIPEGTYIGWLDFSAYGLSPEEVHERIYCRANVVLEDGKLFGDEGLAFQRICTPSPRPLLRQALERIADQF